MPLRNTEVVDLLQTIGDLMELRGDPAFKARAYREAARQLDLAGQDVDTLAREERLTDVKGIGASIAATIKEYLATGRSRQLDQLRQEVPDSLVELLGLRHFGPSRIAKVHQALGVTTLDDLEAAALDGRLERVPGFGRKSVETLIASIAAFREQRRRLPRYLAETTAWNAVHSLRQMAALEQVVVTGDIRRLADTVESVDLLAAAADPAPILDAFRRLSLLHDVSPEDRYGATGYTREKIPVRLRVVPPDLWGLALQHFTGSSAHNQQLQDRAIAAGLHIHDPAAHVKASRRDATQHGWWPGLFLEPDGAPLRAATEEDVYARLGLPLIPPELREARGEVEAARAGTLPRLITLADVRGDLHVHTTWSDGQHTIEQMARQARALGREYLAIADHSQSLGVARGLSLERLAEQRREIRAVDAALDGIRLLSSVELDIRSDGSLDYPDEILSQFDFVTASIHSGFQQPAEQLTRRVIAAMRSPHVDAIGHLTGRMLGRRPPLEMDVEAILRVAAETGTAVEINAWPNRLDVGECYARRAKELGVKLVINTDSHADDQLDYLHYGVEIARRGWLEPSDVLNTLPLDDLFRYLSTRRHKR